MANLSRRKLLLGVASVAVVGGVLASPTPINDVQRTRNGVYKRAAVGFPSPARPPPFAGDWSSPRLSRRQDADVCTTDECKSFADSVLAARAANYTDIDPCTDFAEYTCSGWWASHDFRADQSNIGVLSVMADVNTALMRTILESPYPTNTTLNGTDATDLDKANFEKMIAGYDSCMDTAAIDQVGAKPLQDILDAYEAFSASYGDSSEDLTEKLIWVQQYGGSGLVQATTWADDKTPNITTVALGPGLLGLDAKEYYNDTEAIANYTTAIVGMFDILYGNASHAKNVNLTEGVVALEQQLAAATPDAADTGDVAYYYNPLPIEEADALFPEVSFSRLIKAFAPKNYTISTVIVLSPDYFPQISPIIKETSTEILDAYLKWVLIQTWATRLSNKVNAPYRRLQNELTGRDPDAVGERWGTCLSDVDTNLPWIESAFFVRSAFSPEAKTFGERIITDIENIFMEKLKGYTWMSDSVKTKATQKVLNMVEKIGYPDVSPNVEDPKALADFYATLKVTNDSWFENGLAYNNFSLSMLWNDLLRPTDKDRWFMTAPTVNAYFNPPTNEIAFPAGIMQQPLFNLDLPEYVSYGAFGAVAGHELTHAFDDGGSHYDETGAYRDWWDNATLANFQNKTQCFVEQYSQYSIITPAGEKLNVNGELTLGENIADGGGLNAAFAAWQERNTEAPNQLLPGLEEYTREQLFYLSFGGVWCGKRRPAEAVRRIYSDPHSPPDVRILGTVSNQRGFKEAFNCPVKEPACELW